MQVRHVAVAAMLVVLGFLHVAVLDRTPDFDDHYFATALDAQSLVAFLRERYLHWSGRLPIDALAALLLHGHLWAWRLLNAGAVLWLCANVGRLGFRGRMHPAAATACAFVLLWCMPVQVLREAAWWVSGSLNYLWPTAAGLAALCALSDRRDRGPFAWLGLVVAGGFAAYHEQVAVAMIAIGMPRAAGLWRTGRLGRGDVALLVSILANAAINLGAPGMEERFHSEIARHYPTYLQLGLFDKALLGAQVVAKLARSSNGLLSLLVVGAVIGVAHASTSRIVRFAVLAVCAVVVAAMSTRPQTFPAVAVACAIGALVLCVAHAIERDNRREAAWFAWSMCVGLGTLAAMAFSPTVHGSGARTGFVACVALLVGACRMLAMVRERCGTYAFAWPVGIAGAMAAVRVFELAT